MIVLPFQGEPAPSFRIPRAALRSALGCFVEAFQASGRTAYTLMVGAEPTAIKKPAARCPECGGELECLGVGEYAMLKLRLIAAHAQAIDTS